MNDLVDSNGDCYSVLEEHLGEKKLKRSFLEKYCFSYIRNLFL